MTTKEKTATKYQALLERLLQSVWLFPAILLLILIVLTVLRISGTSVGVYHQTFYGQDSKDPALLYGHPQYVRSDEWLVMTQMTIAQARSGFPHVNPNINTGRDMSIISDVPVKDWSEVFRPQNLSFFVMPLEQAFAFKWWLLLFSLITACYFFVLRLLPGNRLLASTLAVGFGLSPFISWWYQTITIAPLVYGFLMMILGMRVINGEPIRFLEKSFGCKSGVVYGLVIAYVLTAFGLVLYPPFQIPVAITAAAFLLGYLLQNLDSDFLKKGRGVLKPLVVFCTAGVIAILLGGVFVLTRSSAVHSVTHTAYPGNRSIESGGHNDTGPAELLTTFTQPLLQSGVKGIHYVSNKSESSNFILLLPYLLLPAVVLLWYKFRSNHKIEWTLLAAVACAALFILYLYVPGPQVLFRLALLDKVPHNRMMMGLGFVGFIMLVQLMKELPTLHLPKKSFIAIAGGYAAACFIVAVLSGRAVRHAYPIFLSSKLYIICGALYFAVILLTLLLRQKLLTAVLILAISGAAVVRVNPIYQGLGPLAHNKLSVAIEHDSPQKSTWVSVDDIQTENFATLSNRQSLSGVQLYPDVRFWRQLEGAKGDFIYNRYAHVVFSPELDSRHPLGLVQGDWFNVRFACTPFVLRHVQYALARYPLQYDCVRLVQTVKFPAMTYYIYRLGN